MTALSISADREITPQAAVLLVKFPDGKYPATKDVSRWLMRASAGRLVLDPLTCKYVGPRQMLCTVSYAAARRPAADAADMQKLSPVRYQDKDGKAWDVVSAGSETCLQAAQQEEARAAIRANYFGGILDQGDLPPHALDEYASLQGFCASEPGDQISFQHGGIAVTGTVISTEGQDVNVRMPNSLGSMQVYAGDVVAVTAKSDEWNNHRNKEFVEYWTNVYPENREYLSRWLGAYR